MDFNQLVSNLRPEMIAAFKQAVELGRWPNGDVMTEQQRESAMQAIIAYQAMHHPDKAEPFTVNEKGDLLMGKGKVFGEPSNVDASTGGEPGNIATRTLD